MKPACFRWAALLCLIVPAAARAQQLGFAAFAVPEVNTDNPAWASMDGIVAGPDGAMWFTEFRTCEIGRIATSGAITQYPLSCSRKDAGPRGITVGPDGALWFTARDTIGRITTSGEV